MVKSPTLAGKENPLQAATHIFDESIYGIRDSQIDGLKDVDRRTVDRIRNRELFVVANNAPFLFQLLLILI